MTYTDIRMAKVTAMPPRLATTVREASLDPPANEMRLRESTRDTSLPPRRSISTAGLDVFWPILAVVLVVAVIFVATVAHSSMDGVGVPLAQNAMTPPQPTTAAGPILIVQVSSHVTRSAAQAAVKDLTDRGITARVLKSDNYSPLNRGYFVVFTGPYPRTAVGRAEAKRIQTRIPGALLRDVLRRSGTAARPAR